MPAPILSVVTPLTKFVPRRTIVVSPPRRAEAGATLASVGAGLLMVNVLADDVPPPGAGLVTVTLWTPVAAPPVIVMFAVSCVELFTATEFWVIAVSAKSTPVAPLTNLVPVKTTSSVWERLPTEGTMEVSVGAGFVTMNPFFSVSVPPPGEIFFTTTFRGPVAAEGDIVMFAVSPVVLSMVVLFRSTSGPSETLVIPAMKLVP